jgi:peptidoglycan hydrolase CwlO-like protein
MEATKEKHWNEEQLKLSDEIGELLDEVSEQECIIKESLAKINKVNRMIRILEKRMVKRSNLQETRHTQHLT